MFNMIKVFLRNNNDSIKKNESIIIHNFYCVVALLAMCAPFISHAQVVNNIKDIGLLFSNILQAAIVLLIGIAVVVFLWSIFKYLTEGKNEAKREEAKKYMIYGVSAIFIMVSVWGLVGLLNETTNIQPFLGLPDRK